MTALFVEETEQCVASPPCGVDDLLDAGTEPAGGQEELEREKHGADRARTPRHRAAAAWTVTAAQVAALHAAVVVLAVDERGCGRRRLNALDLSGVQ
ncbi:MAG: hypothetical protein AAGG08_21265 [Actinomycetota bacterium]